MENFRFIEELCVYLQSNLVHSARANTNHREVAP